VPEGSTEKPEYPRTSELLYAFCVDGLTNPSDMIRRLNHAERDDAALPKAVVTEVRGALWDLASDTFNGGTVGRPPGTYRGVAWIGRRRSI
jgi:hypothetical protein